MSNRLRSFNKFGTMIDVMFCFYLLNKATLKAMRRNRGRRTLNKQQKRKFHIKDKLVPHIPRSPCRRRLNTEQKRMLLISLNIAFSLLKTDGRRLNKLVPHVYRQLREDWEVHENEDWTFRQMPHLSWRQLPTRGQSWV